MQTHLIFYQEAIQLALMVLGKVLKKENGIEYEIFLE